MTIDFEGKRTAMLVWNGFVHDARVTREAESLVGAGMQVLVISLMSPVRPIANETTVGGVKVHRVSRQNHWLTRLILAPRILLLWLAAKAKGLSTDAVRAGLARRARWWELDMKFAMLLEVLVGNVQMILAAIRHRPDFVHANDVNTLLPGWLASRFSRSKLVYDAHEISADREGYRGRVWLVRLVEKYLGRAADGRLTTTQTRADWFISNYHYLDMGVVQNRPEFVEADGDRIRETFSIPENALVVLYQGGLQPGRGLHNLIEAVALVPEVHLVFVGDGRQRVSLEHKAARISDRVYFVGQVPLEELPSWTASADVGVQTLRNTCLNHYSTDSNKLFEYVMGGLPVVASRFPEIEKIVSEFEVGLLVDPSEIAQISDALRSFVQEPEFRSLCASNALIARKSLDWKSQESAFLGVYRQALGNE